jgi:hypothetical protein
VEINNACPEATEGCPKTLDAGLAQITVGLAWHNKKYTNEQTEEDRERYTFAEKEPPSKKADRWADNPPLNNPPHATGGHARQTGKPTQNALIGSFNGRFQGRGT